MDVAVFNTKPYDRRFLESANVAHGHTLIFLEARLTQETAALAQGHDAVCVFVNDRLDHAVLEQLAAAGIKLIALRSAGYNNVDLIAADKLGLTVTRVPAYSPYAVAEHTIALVLTLNRKIHRAYNRVREGNFAIDGLLGFDLHGRTVGVVGAGRDRRVIRFARLAQRSVAAPMGCAGGGSDRRGTRDHFHIPGVGCHEFHQLH